MLWYHASTIIDDKGYPEIDCPIVFDRLLSKIRQLEEDHVKVVSKIELNTKKLVEGEFEFLLKKSKIFLKQEDYVATFSVVTKKLYMRCRLLREDKRIILRSVV